MYILQSTMDSSIFARSVDGCAATPQRGPLGAQQFTTKAAAHRALLLARASMWRVVEARQMRARWL
jgi:hypothetical protein